MSTASPTVHDIGGPGRGRRTPRPVTPVAAGRSARPISRAAQELLALRPEWIPPTASALELGFGIASGTAAALASPLLEGPLLALFAPLGTDPETIRPRPEEMGDPGWFGPDSVAWWVHADHSMLVAGITAFTLQTLHPLAMAGVAEHSAFSEDFLGRTRRTGDFVQAVVYGSSAEAERYCRTVHKIHERVVGTTPDGRDYAANDPDLLHWVHITQYAAIAAANRRFGLRPMSRHDLDTYVHEAARVGTEIGVPDPPHDWAGINAALERHRPALSLYEYGAASIRFLEDPPIIPSAAKPVWRALWTGAVACLPPVARELLRLPMPPAHQLLAARGLLRTIGALGSTPPRLTAARLRLGLPA